MNRELDDTTIARIDDAMRRWRHGDVASAAWIGHLGDPSQPLTSATAAVAGPGGPTLVAAAVEALVLLTQTCDVTRSCRDRPFLQFAPLVRLEEEHARQMRSGRRPRYAHVPALGADAAADLDRVMTIEKALVATLDRTEGLRNAVEGRRFAAAVGRKYRRVAFPDDLKIALRPLTDRAQRQHGRRSAEGRALAALEEIRITAVPGWEAAEASVFLTFSPGTREAADAVLAADEWDRLIDSWVTRCRAHGVITAVDGALIPLDELSALDYVLSDPLDLDHLSP